MMKMATGEEFPLRQGAGTGLDWFSVATEASGGGTPDLFYSSKFLGYMDIYIGGRSTSVDLRAIHEAGGCAQGGWVRPPPLWAAQDSSGPSPILRGLLLVQKRSL